MAKYKTIILYIKEQNRMSRIDEIMKKGKKVKAKVDFTGGKYDRRTGKYMNWGYAYVLDPDAPILHYLQDRIFISPRDMKRLGLLGIGRLEHVLLYVRRDSKGRLYGADVELVKYD